MALHIHTQIKEKLWNFHEARKVPHLLFHGPSGAGKSTLVNEFVLHIYGGDAHKMKHMSMFVNCAHGKGIRFIREELKFFAKTQIYSNGGDTFKTIVLYNGDKLTTDAQSALRRCIELFSHTTRFFILVEDKYKLLKPILSRLCEIYVPLPENIGHLYQYHVQKTFATRALQMNRMDWLRRELKKPVQPNELAQKLYERGYSAMDLIRWIELDTAHLDELKKYELLVAFDKARKEMRDERLLMLFVLHFTFVDRESIC
jgi:hypothetical protein